MLDIKLKGEATSLAIVPESKILVAYRFKGTTRVMIWNEIYFVAAYYSLYSNYEDAINIKIKYYHLYTWKIQKYVADKMNMYYLNLYTGA